MKKLYLLILWHMHQPLYRSPCSGLYELPWTFLHAIKDYYDMPNYLKDFNVKVNFNLTPVLMDQIEEYAHGRANCRLINLVKRDEPTEEDRNFLKVLIKKLPATMARSVGTLDEGKRFEDLKILYLLTWCGRYLRENSQIVKNLIDKGGGFTKEEKELLLSELLELTSKILDLYRELKSEGRIEVSTSPYYHPILPILCDPESVKEADPEAEIPDLRDTFKEDCILHVERAKERYKEVFGEHPSYMWPPEGAISKGVLEELGRRGIKLVAGDEVVLKRSDPNASTYKRYKFKNVNIVFRDRNLSDHIGFVYQGWEAQEAVNHFLQSLRRICESTPFSPLVSVILDGENCWDYYEENGRRFLSLLYSRIEEEDWIETVRLSDLESIETPCEELEDLKAGTWLYGSFKKWIGEREKNRRWERLAEVRKRVSGKALEYMLPAEGSDWMWWCGDEERDETIEVFDKLFECLLKRAEDEGIGSFQ